MIEEEKELAKDEVSLEAKNSEEECINEKDDIIAHLYQLDIDPVLADNDSVEDSLYYNATKRTLFSTSFTGLDMTWTCLGVVFASIIFYFRSPGLNAFSNLAPASHQISKISTPFFNSDKVHDFYAGDLELEQLRMYGQLSIVFIYSTWSIDSVYIRNNVENVASFFENHDYIKFFAVNCFTSSSLCQERYKIPIFPMLVAYTAEVTIVYKGPIDVEYIKQWVADLQRPFKEVRNFEKFKKVQEESETIVLGFLPFYGTKSPYGFKTFFHTSLMFKKGYTSDRTTTFCLIRHEKLGKSFGLYRKGIYILNKSGEIQSYYNKSMNSQEILHWINTERTNTNGQLIHLEFDRTTELKTTQLASLLAESPVIILTENVSEDKAVNINIINVFAKMANEYWDCSTDYISADTMENVKGLGCLVNNSMRFVYMSNNEHSHILEKIGLSKFKSHVFIINSKQEFFTIMKEVVTEENLKHFISNFHHNMLFNIPLSSELWQHSSKTHFLENEHLRNAEHLVIPYINGSALENMIQNRKEINRDAIIFFSGGSDHGFSMAVLPYLHQVAQYFKPVSEFIIFYIMDASRSPLPYKFNFSKLPTIMLIPFHNSSTDSITFRSSEKFTVSSIFDFILSNASPQLSWSARLRSCNNLCAVQNLHKLQYIIQENKKRLRRYRLCKNCHTSRQRVLIHLSLQFKLMNVFATIGEYGLCPKAVRNFTVSREFYRYSHLNT